MAGAQGVGHSFGYQRTIVTPHSDFYDRLDGTAAGFHP
jgi:hypothetical protein